MKLVLLSGGSGKRLWPLSNDTRSKQFLRLLKSPEGQPESMVQRVWRQIGEAGLTKDTMVSTSSAQAELLQSQLGDVKIMIEPERRDTFPAIALAVAYLYSKDNVDLDETIVIMPVDPFVETDFMKKLTRLDEVLQHSHDLALIGVKPTFPSEQYGYIVPSQSRRSDGSIMPVLHFREKPDYKEANTLMDMGALWNCGVFAFKLDTMIQILMQKGYPIYYDQMIEQYGKLPKISFDYEVVESMNSIGVLKYEGLWKDLGTWEALTEEVPNHINGEVNISADCCNTHVFNELDIPVTVLGCPNLIVASSPDGILVADKAHSDKIKEMMKHTHKRPMFEERRWGWHKILAISQSNGQDVVVKQVLVKAGCHPTYHYHLKRDEVWTITVGEGEFLINDKRSYAKVGDVLVIPAGSRHTIRAIIDLEFIEVQRGIEITEDDIEVVHSEWPEIVKPIAR
ncbi:sugar phosphate nucleotidyltransferase [Cohnella sp.]|uniref:sugar phosphate nucleotidyltransferase n=1 Tax=Cohnella sp. TaxID=1883426 RepID=UPI003561C9F2